MAECSSTTSQQAAEVNSLNAKLAYDFAAQLQNQALLDNQRHADSLRSLELRASESAETLKHLATLGVISAGQTGVTENQNLVKPTPNTVADDNAAVASGAISSATAQATLGNVTAQLATLTTQVTTLADTLSAFLAQMIANAGSAGAKQTASAA